MGFRLLILFLAFAIAVPAAPLQLIYNGVFNTQNALNLASDSTPTFFAEPTPFTINAWFDTSTTNLAPSFGGPFDGFRAFAPSKVTITIGGKAYDVETIDTNPAAGATVAVFDTNSFTPGHYGVGILQDPPADGAGIIGDFEGASPDFTASAITPTVFTKYFGVGYGSGVCLVGPPDACLKNAVTPFVLHDGLAVYSLTLGNYDEDYPDIHIEGNIPGPLNEAMLVEAPEPGTFGLTLTALAFALGALKRRRA